MSTFVPDALKIEKFLGDPRHVKLLEDFHFRSKVLDRWCHVPKGFVSDFESIPLLKGTNPEAGIIHDYFSRRDSKPVVRKLTAARIYEEFQKYFDDMEERSKFSKIWDWIRRKVKTSVVRIWPGYWHKYSVSCLLNLSPKNLK